MKSRVIKTGLALMLTASMILPSAPYGFAQTVQAAEAKSMVSEIGDTNGDGVIDAVELVRLKKSQKQQEGYTDNKFDLNNDGSCDAKDMKLMHDFLLGSITSFYRPDTSANNNDTSNYTVTDELDREMTVAGKTKNKTVGIRYFLHFGTGDSNQLYSVSNILATDSHAASSDDAWTAAGGGAVGTKHWWGEPIFGYYFSTDAWVLDRDVQMLTDAGIDFIAVDTTEGKLYEAQLVCLMDTLLKYQKQGFVVPKVAFTDTTLIESDLASYKSAHAEFNELWYETADVSSISKEVVKVADRNGNAMSAGAFYQSTDVEGRNYNGTTSVTGDDAYKNGYHFEFEFEAAIASGTDTILIDCWNEWLAERKTGTSSQAIVLEENANAEYSSDIQPMKDGYGDDYYMQMVDYIKQFKGKFITNRNLNTASTTESVSIDVNGDFNQWNKVSTHYLDYTDDIADRNSDGYSTEAKAVNQAVGIDVANMSADAGKIPFVSKKSYRKGTTVTFRAYMPSGVKSDDSWWKVGYCTDPSKKNVYESSGASMFNASNVGKWADYSFTVEEDNSHLAIAAPPGNGWREGNVAGGKSLLLLLDSFVITDSNGNVLNTEEFEGDLSDSIFTINKTIVTSQTGEAKLTNPAVSIDVAKMSGDAGKLAFYSKNTYSAGSTVKFRAYFPAGVKSGDEWWNIAVTKDPTNSSIYDIASSSYDESKVGKWADYEIHIPDDGAYYLAFTSNPSSWTNAEGRLLLDNFVVTDSNNNVLANETFDNGIAGSIFKVDTNVISIVEGEVTKVNTSYMDTTGRNDISKMKMTSDDTYLYCYAETKDDIQGWGTEKCMSLFLSTGNIGGCWEQYEYVVNRDSSKAKEGKVRVEKYVGGEWTNVGTAQYKLEGKSIHFAIPLSLFRTANGLNLEFKWADNYGDDVYSFYLQGDVAPYGRLNYTYKISENYVALRPYYISDADLTFAHFITKKAYPGGTTIKFRANVPSSLGWWAVGYTTDKTKVDKYPKDTDDLKVIGVTQGTRDIWCDYEFTVPEGRDYYFFITGPSDEGAKDYIFLDDFEIQNSNIVEKDNFNHGLESGLFDVVEKNKDSKIVVALKNATSELTDKVVSVNMRKLRESQPMNFISADAYPAGSTISFRVKDTSAEWWALGWTTDKKGTKDTTTTSFNYVGLYPQIVKPDGNTASGKDVPGNDSRKGQWSEYSFTLPDNGNKYYFYLACGKDLGWENQEFLVDDVRIVDKNQKLLAKDNFDEGFENGLFDITEKNGNDIVVSLQEKNAIATGNQAVSINPTQVEEYEMNFATKKKYPAGCTITFDAYFPENSDGTWWNLQWTTDVGSMSIYTTSGFSQGLSTAYAGKWANYTVTLSSQDASYIYWGMEKSSTKWNGNILIDNVKIKNASGKVIAQDNFNNGIDNGLFQYNASAVSLVSVEETTTDEQMDFTAYASPTVKGNITEDDVETLDATYKKMAEAGFTKAIALNEGASYVEGSDIYDTIQKRSKVAEDTAILALDIAEKYNLKYYVRDWSFYDLGIRQNEHEDTSEINTKEKFATVINTMFGSNNPYINKPAYAGNFAFDEPSTENLEKVQWQMEYYYQNVMNGGEMFVNLLPFEEGGNSNKYKTYLNNYFNNLAPTLGYASFDHYPFKESGLEVQYYNNLYDFAKRCRDSQDSQGNRVELRAYIQARGDSKGLRNINGIEDLRYQAYTNMAFGVKEMIYYSYSTGNPEGTTPSEGGYSLFNYNTQEYTSVYDWAKKVNNEIHQIESYYLDYQWQNIMCKLGDGHKSNALFNKVTGAAKSLDGIDIYCTEDTLVGSFTAKTTGNGRDNGYMFVNASNPESKLTNTVVVTFDNANGNVSAVSVCKNGSQTIEKVSSNEYTFTLKPGEGAFIIPLTK